MRLKIVISYVIVFAVGALAARFVMPGGNYVHLASSTSEQSTAGQCAAHGIDKTLCTRCNPALIVQFQVGNDWCAEHAVPESRCTRCNPSLIPQFKEQADWCDEHNLPESQCDICNPILAEVDVHEDHSGHDHSESGVAERSGMTPYPGIAVSYASAEPHCPSDGAVIQLASVETAARAGIEVQAAITAPTSHPFEAPAEVVFDQAMTTTLTSTLAIAIREWRVEPGAEVATGEPLATVDSPDMAALQGEYLEAWSDWRVHARERDRAVALLSRALIDSASYERAVADAVASQGKHVQKRSQLLLAGMSEIDVERLREDGSVSSRFTLRSPVAGTVLDRPAGLGAVLESGTTLATIGARDALWIEGRVRDRDLPRLEVGQKTEFLPDAGEPRPVTGTIIWISQFLDPHTRTGTVRVRPDRADAGIWAHEFGRLHIADAVDETSILVPKDAVQWEGCCNIVFVRETADRYYPRKVTVERTDNGHYRVVDGLEAGEEVVVRGSFLLKTEIKKSSIGAGCCGLEASS